MTFFYVFFMCFPEFSLALAIFSKHSDNTAVAFHKQATYITQQNWNTRTVAKPKTDKLHTFNPETDKLHIFNPETDKLHIFNPETDKLHTFNPET